MKSPDRDSFIAELAQNHLVALEWCRLPQSRLETIVRALIEMVESAASLSSQDPSRHYPRDAADGQIDPQLIAKRITVDTFNLRSRELASTTFRYLPTLTEKPLANTNKDLIRFKTKLCRGGLDDYVVSLRNQMLSAEAVFLDLATRGPDGQADLRERHKISVSNILQN